MFTCIYDGLHVKSRRIRLKWRTNYGSSRVGRAGKHEREPQSIVCSQGTSRRDPASRPAKQTEWVNGPLGRPILRFLNRAVANVLPVTHPVQCFPDSAIQLTDRESS